MDFFEVVHTQRSIRKFKPDPVPDEAIWKMIDAAIRAPSGGNTQPWMFLVIRDPEKRKALADAVREGVGDLEKALEAAEQLPTESQRRMRRSSVTFRSDVASAPVLILIGAAMFRSVTAIDFARLEDGLPAFLTIVLIPLTFSITQGILWGFISHVGLYCLTGRRREVHPVMYVLAAVSIGLLVLEHSPLS